MNGELISRSKCKRQASLQTSKCLQTYIQSKHTDSSEQAKQANQLTLIKDIGIQLSERNLTQQTGRAELLTNKKEIYHTLVFLPGPENQLTFPSSDLVIQSAPNEPVITDTGQDIHWLVEPSDDISFLDELLATAVPEVPAQSHLGELNTPTIGKLLMFHPGRSLHLNRQSI